jgi:hypothetical protein
MAKKESIHIRTRFRFIFGGQFMIQELDKLSLLRAIEPSGERHPMARKRYQKGWLWLPVRARRTLTLLFIATPRISGSAKRNRLQAHYLS